MYSVESVDQEEDEVVVVVGVILRFLIYVKNCVGNSARSASTTETSPSVNNNNHNDQRPKRCLTNQETQDSHCMSRNATNWTISRDAMRPLELSNFSPLSPSSTYTTTNT